SFRDGDRPIAGCTDRPVIVAYAFCVTTFTTAGPHPITAVYSGDGLHTTSTGFTSLNVSAEPDSVQFVLGLLLQFLKDQHLVGL
ncbi:MAG: Ig-like domain-containing protein, partial [Mycobacteriaceae bacterium]